MANGTLAAEQRGPAFAPPGHPQAEGTNVAELVLRHVRSRPEATAIVHCRRQGGPAASRVTFGELGTAAARYATGLRAAGIRPGDRLALLGPVSADFYALAIGVLAVGAVVVVVDGSMQAARVARALWDARPTAIVGPRRILRYWPFVPALSHAARYAAEGRSIGVKALDELRGDAHELSADPRPHESPAVVSFTSGTTGRPKAIVRSHGLLRAQHVALAAHFPAGPDEISLAAFPMVVLHNLCSGVASVLAPPATDIGALESAIVEQGVTSLACAPALLDRLLARLAARGASLPSLRRVVVGGGPVSRVLCERLTSILPRAHGVVAYGSTEAEPIASVGFHEVIASSGDGYLVGSPAGGVEVALVCLPDHVPPLGPMGLVPFHVPAGIAGEIVVRGAHVRARRSDGTPTRSAIASADGRHWHRTGDIARVDARGRLWLLGRTGDVVVHHGRQFHPFAIEAALAGIRGVTAAALVAHPSAPHGEIVIALGTLAPADTIDRVRTMLDARGLGRLPIRQVARIPMDARHASKVDRVALRTLLRFGA